MERIMVVGAGQMGSGIAQVHIEAGFQVILHDIDREHLDKGRQTIAYNLERNVKKQRISEQEKAEMLARIRYTTDFNEAKHADLIIEAAVEKLDVKRDIFLTLDQIAPKETILATNTSALPITELAATTRRPDKVIGMHFMNPVPVMKLVEIIRALQTSDDVFQTIEALAYKLKKTPVTVRDFPGFVSNRILMPMINEAIFALYEGVAEKEAIDEVMKLGMNHPIGPLALADLIGLDTCLYIMETLHEQFGDDKYRPCPLLRKYVEAGWLGRKTGRGFYTYHSSEA